MRHHAVPAGGAVWLRGVVLPDEGTRVLGGVRHHADPAGGAS